MRLSADCIACMVKGQLRKLEGVEDEALRADYMSRAAAIIAACPHDEASPDLVPVLDDLFYGMFKRRRDLSAEKRQFNELLLSREDDIRSSIEKSQDRFLAALKFSRTGNYIDYGVVKDVSGDELTRLIERTPASLIDEAEYAHLKDELKSAKRLAFLCDNAGEVVLDKLFLENIVRLYPHLGITAVVRGADVLNDATMDDARLTGLSATVHTIPNGDRGAGTNIKKISAEARGVIESADVVISKGQGNFETLHGSGLNIYYMFLCKCRWFAESFGVERMGGMFVNERRTPPIF